MQTGETRSFFGVEEAKWIFCTPIVPLFPTAFTYTYMYHGRFQRFGVTPEIELLLLLHSTA